MVSMLAFQAGDGGSIPLTRSKNKKSPEISPYTSPEIFILPFGLKLHQWNFLKVTTGIEPVMEVLQTSALPLGYVTVVFLCFFTISKKSLKFNSPLIFFGFYGKFNEV